eukprot:702580-Pleurochrysis_carterae.AAC.1
MGRGAILAGAEVVGFDIARRPSTCGLKAVSCIGGRYESYPAPNIIHASPLCNEFSALRRFGTHEAQGPPTAQMLIKHCITWSNIDAGECSWMGCMCPGLWRTYWERRALSLK